MTSLRCYGNSAHHKIYRTRNFGISQALVWIWASCIDILVRSDLYLKLEGVTTEKSDRATLKTVLTSSYFCTFSSTCAKLSSLFWFGRGSSGWFVVGGYRAGIIAWTMEASWPEWGAAAPCPRHKFSTQWVFTRRVSTAWKKTWKEEIVVVGVDWGWLQTLRVVKKYKLCNRNHKRNEWHSESGRENMY